MTFLENIFDITFIIQLIKVAIFIFAFTFGTSYMIPKGILLYFNWKETKNRRELSSSVSLIMSGLFIFFYFLAMFILESPRLYR
jgi:hypothetical protein